MPFFKMYKAAERTQILGTGFGDDCWRIFTVQLGEDQETLLVFTLLAGGSILCGTFFKSQEVSRRSHWLHFTLNNNIRNTSLAHKEFSVSELDFYNQRTMIMRNRTENTKQADVKNKRPPTCRSFGGVWCGIIGHQHLAWLAHEFNPPPTSEKRTEAL